MRISSRQITCQHSVQHPPEDNPRVVPDSLTHQQLDVTLRLPCQQLLTILVKMASSGKLRHVALVRTDVSEERSASFIRVTRIGELVTTLAVTSNRTCYFFAACFGC
jgi:hypothetical protein